MRLGNEFMDRTVKREIEDIKEVYTYIQRCHGDSEDNLVL